MTTATDPAPTGELTHAAALAEADVDALEAFLTARLDAVQRTYVSDSDEYCTARALRSALWDLIRPVRASFRYDDGSPELLRARLRHWNRLHRLAEPWARAEGYDVARWTYLLHLDAADEESSAEYARRREQEQAAYERARLLGSV
ncbi:hypothetical protein [Streptomyces chrestomyceticus]|uniref:hypothetical protein n=1 Tax=Streptomyces chrestomyceticus TaxID=68185 RepID=UPI0034013AD3